MYYVFSHSAVGYSHLKSKKPCQDYSSLYKDLDRTIITSCDGHGGEVYIRSHKGSYMASLAIMNIFKDICYKDLVNKNSEDVVNKIKLNILCEWNRLAEHELLKHPITKGELSSLNEKQIDSLKENPLRIFGTTLTGAMVFKNKLIVVGIGDSEVIGIRHGEMKRLLEQEDDPAGNVTYSMCQEDAYQYIRVNIFDWKDFDGVLLCTDGLSSPYQSYDNFNNSFIKPYVLKLIKTGSVKHFTNLVYSLGSELGIGDDVSLSFILKKNINSKYYR